MKTALLAILLAAAILIPVPSVGRANGFPDQDKHHAMLRLEDVGPVINYETPDEHRTNVASHESIELIRLRQQEIEKIFANSSEKIFIHFCARGLQA